MSYEWEMFAPVNGDRVRRLSVAGGWLYQVEKYEQIDDRAAGTFKVACGWHPPVFVPEK